MSKTNQTIVTSMNETFLVRVLIKKIQDAGLDASFVPWKINDLSVAMDSAELVTIYMEEGERPTEKVINFLNERVINDGKKLILVGEKSDLQIMEKLIPRGLIFHSFERPVDNAGFIETVRDFFEKKDEDGFRKNILVVDDDPNFLGLVREWLKDIYSVSMANSGLQAIKYLGKNKVDLILLDHEMPVTSGPQVLEMLRSDDETKHIPVIFLTGKSDKESVMEVVSLKPEGYFLKTIEKKELLRKLEQFFLERGEQ